MIYRAFDCSVYDSSEDSVTVWFEAYSQREAGDRLIQLLSLAWQVAAEAVYTGGNLDSVFEIERNSVEPPQAGNRRWLEAGSLGCWPTYSRAPEIIMLRARGARELAEARREAQTHARYLAEQCGIEAGKVPEGPRQERQVENWHYHQADYLKFAAGVVGYDD